MKYAFLLLIASTGPLVAAPSEDPQEILKRAGSAWEKLKSCQIVASSTTVSAGDDSEVTIKSKVHISAENPGKLRVENRGVGGELTVSNGVDTWTYFPMMKQYTKNPASGSLQGELGSSPGVHSLLIQSKAKSAKLTGQEDVVIEHAPHRCYVIEVEAEHGEHYRYWIDETNYLILRTEMTGYSPAGMTGSPTPTHMTHNTVVESLKIDDAIAASVFTFTPPADAKLVSQFGGGNATASSQYVGKSAADFTLRDLNGKVVRLSDLRGKTVVLDFWATWCGPCKEEMPELDEIQKGNKEVVILGLDVAEDETLVKKFVADNHIGFRILLAGQDRVIQDYGANGYPTTVVVDKNGIIRSYTVGYGPGGDSNLRAAIERAGKEMDQTGVDNWSGSLYRVGNGVSAPHVISKVDPQYTEEARNANLSGTVLLSTVVTPDGEPKNIHVVKPLGLGLDQKAMEAVAHWRFQPGMKDGKPVAVQATIEVNFRLLDKQAGPNPQTAAPKPKTAEEAYFAGARLIRERHAEEGIRLLDQAIAMKPDWAYPWWARGNAYYQQRRYEEAIESISKAIELRGTMAGWYDVRGLALSYSGHHERAILDYTKAIELSPNVAGGYNNRGWAYVSLDQPEKALPDLNRAIELTPDYIRAYENRGLAHLKLKQYSEAIADYTAAIELGPTQGQYEQRAQVKAAMGDEKGAAEDRNLAALLKKPAAPAVTSADAGGPARKATVRLQPSDPIDESLAAPELVAPADEVVFDSYPRSTVCEWKPSPGAASYILQWDVQSNGVWRLDQQNGEGVGYPVEGTTYTFNFVGAQPGRWRVWPVGASGTRGKPSEWRTFRYTK